jgi:hypothetical protein
MLVNIFSSRKLFLKYYIIGLFFFFTFSISGLTQNKYCADEIKDMNLPFLPGKINTWYSAGVEKRATELKGFLERASKLFEDSLKVKIDLTMAVLAPKEWEVLMDKPYGLPTMRRGTCKRSNEKFPKPLYAAILPGAVDGPVYDGWMQLKYSLSPATIQKLKKEGIAFEQGGKY